MSALAQIRLVLSTIFVCLCVCALMVPVPITSAQSETTATLSPTVTLMPSLTPTLGKLITRTPSPRAICPPKTAVTFTFDADKFYTLHGKHYRFDERQLLDYLNQTGSADGLKTTLEQQVGVSSDAWFFDRIQILSADVTDDGIPDVLMSFTFTDIGNAILLVFTCKDGHYLNVLNQGYEDESRGSGEHDVWGIYKVQDMNADGVADILFRNLYHVGTHGGSSDVFIWEWNGSGFDSLTGDDIPSNNLLSYGNIDTHSSWSITLRKHENGTYLVVVTAPPSKASQYGGSVTERTEEIIYAWNGEAFTRFCSTYLEPAEYRAQAVMDGDNESNCRNYKKALTAYQQAIFNDNLLRWNNLLTWGFGECCWDRVSTLAPDPNERPNLEAYARYRIILLHVVQNELIEAKTDYELLRQKFPSGSVGYQFARLADAFWSTYIQSKSVSTACKAAVDYVNEHTTIPEFFGKYKYTETREGGSWPAFALSYNAGLICPFD